MPRIRTHVLASFDDPRCPLDQWDHLLAEGETPVVFLTWQWLRAWWETLGLGRLLLVIAERDGETLAIAPFYTLAGMVFFLGCGNADYLDFIGGVHDPEILSALLQTARESVSDFVGFRLHGLLERSSTGRWLQELAPSLGLDCVLEQSIAAVEVNLAGQMASVRNALDRSMRKREEAFRRRGRMEIRRFRDARSIQPHLSEFFHQHVVRWQAKNIPSPFESPRERAFIERLLEIGARCDWIRFLRLDWEECPLAFEFAWYFRGTHYSAPWCFAVEQARYCPGHVLLRQSLLGAIEEGLSTYDLGLGDQEYKFRFPAQVKACYTWGLYPI